MRECAPCMLRYAGCRSQLSNITYFTETLQKIYHTLKKTAYYSRTIPDYRHLTKVEEALSAQTMFVCHNCLLTAGRRPDGGCLMLPVS